MNLRETVRKEPKYERQDMLQDVLKNPDGICFSQDDDGLIYCYKENPDFCKASGLWVGHWLYWWENLAVADDYQAAIISREEMIELLEAEND